MELQFRLTPGEEPWEVIQVTARELGTGLVIFVHLLLTGAGLVRIIHSREKLAHRRFSLVAHVGNAEGSALDLPVTAVDQETLVLNHLL